MVCASRELVVAFIAGEEGEGGWEQLGHLGHYWSLEASSPATEEKLRSVLTYDGRRQHRRSQKWGEKSKAMEL